MAIAPEIASLPGITHHHVDVNGTHLHYVKAGTSRLPMHTSMRECIDRYIAGATAPHLD
jgi:hypothetical protein